MKKRVLSLIPILAVLLGAAPGVLAAGNGSVPETREATPVALLVVVLLVSVCGLVALLLLKKKDKDQE